MKTVYCKSSKPKAIYNEIRNNLDEEFLDGFDFAVSKYVNLNLRPSKNKENIKKQLKTLLDIANIFKITVRIEIEEVL